MVAADAYKHVPSLEQAVEKWEAREEDRLKQLSELLPSTDEFGREIEIPEVMAYRARHGGEPWPREQAQDKGSTQHGGATDTTSEQAGTKTVKLEAETESETQTELPQQPEESVGVGDSAADDATDPMTTDTTDSPNDASAGADAGAGAGESQASPSGPAEAATEGTAQPEDAGADSAMTEKAADHIAEPTPPASTVVTEVPDSCNIPKDVARPHDKPVKGCFYISTQITEETERTQQPAAKLVSLGTMLDYTRADCAEKTMEVSLFAEAFHDMLQRDCGLLLHSALVRTAERMQREREAVSAKAKAVAAKAKADTEAKAAAAKAAEEAQKAAAEKEPGVEGGPAEGRAPDGEEASATDLGDKDAAVTSDDATAEPPPAEGGGAMEQESSSADAAADAGGTATTSTTGAAGGQDHKRKLEQVSGSTEDAAGGEDAPGDDGDDDDDADADAADEASPPAKKAREEEVCSRSSWCCAGQAAFRRWRACPRPVESC
jgi:hypothetical protein